MFIDKLKEILKEEPFDVRKAEALSIEMNNYEFDKNKELSLLEHYLWRQLTDKIIAERLRLKDLK